MNKRFHNEFDEDMVVCPGCVDFINEGVFDDREHYHSPTETSEDCEMCGAPA